MSIATLLLPDFALILLGFALARLANWGGHFWAGVEKMVYYLMFPALLFYTTSRTTFSFQATGHFIQVAVIATFSGILLGWLAKPLFTVGPRIFESGVQTAFRFNSYIALALASRLAGEQGTALMALLIGFLVPICNMAAIYALAHNGGKLLKEIASNPLVIGTASGVLCSIFQIPLHEALSATLSRLGNASIALGLLAVGAGMRLSALHEAKGIVGYFLAIKLLALPCIALVLGRYFQLPPLQLQIVVIFSALPTASSAYVLAARMGGNGPLVAFIISASTLLSVVTLPFWLALTR
ncbi:MAG: AEC family transporter [Undibacterium sp.]|nr:AEC family transporter [Undibacterium sp.]